MEIVLNGMTAAIAGAAVTLTPTAGQVLPAHLGPTTVVINDSTNPAHPEFWEVTATKKAKYTIIIRREW